MADEEEKPKNKFLEILKNIFKGIFNVVKAIVTAIQNFMKSQWKIWDEEEDEKRKKKKRKEEEPEEDLYERYHREIKEEYGQ